MLLQVHVHVTRPLQSRHASLVLLGINGGSERRRYGNDRRRPYSTIARRGYLIGTGKTVIFLRPGLPPIARSRYIGRSG